jgi:hypothetical protein
VDLPEATLDTAGEAAGGSFWAAILAETTVALSAVIEVVDA